VWKTGVMAATGGDAPQEVMVVPRHLHPYLAACLFRIRAQLIHEAGQEKRKFAIDVCPHQTTPLHFSPHPSVLLDV
jgi:hypothetical protein